MKFDINKKLEHFKVDTTRHRLVVDVEFYQMPLSRIIDIVRKQDPEAFLDDGVFLPSWSKFGAYPVKAKGFYTRMLQSIFLGQHSAPELNVDYQTNRNLKKEGPKVAMMFLPGSMTNENLGHAETIAQEALKGFVVQAVYGEEMSNATAERRCKDVIEKAFKDNKSVLLLSAGMAQRSFSIPEITELYLAYDSGDNGATIQKMSRALTPDKVGKVGRVISLSFDPNRDDKFDAIMIETAQNYKRNKDIKDLKEALRTVIQTVDIFRCGVDGADKLDVDTYLEEALSRNSIDRIVGKIADLTTLSPAELTALAQGKADVFRAAQQETAEKGKTKLDPTKKAKSKSSTNADKELIAKARAVIVTIAQNIDIIRYQGGNTIDEAFNIIDNRPDNVKEGITEDFGVDYDLIKDLVLSGIIKRDLLELKFS
jgi:hypothetical protein